MKRILLTSVLACSAIGFGQTVWENDYLFSNNGVNNGVESVYGTVELSDGSFLIGGTANKPSPTAYVANIAANGDSLWVRYYDASYCGFTRCANLYYNNAGDVYGVFETGYGKMSFTKLNATNGDTISHFCNPHGDATGWHYYDHVELDNGDYILAYTQGNSTAGMIERFTPGATTPQWNNDYAGAVIAPSHLMLDGNAVVAAGYCGGSGWSYDMCALKLNTDGSEIFRKKFIRNSYYRDTPCGVVKNQSGNYLITGSWYGTGGTVLPSVLTIDGTTGDSLSISILTSANGKQVNLGFIDKLIAGNNFYVGVGEIDENVTDPDGNDQNVGYMAAFIIDESGNFTTTYIYNDLAPYPTNPGYVTCSDWAYSVQLTSTNDILAGGRGNYSYVNGAGAIAHTTDSYLVKISGASLGLKEQEQQHLLAYPNPAQESFTFSAPGKGKLQLFDASGRIVLEVPVENSLTTVETGTLAPGIYTLAFGNDIQITGTGRIVIR